jgi:hypothetical protein
MNYKQLNAQFGVAIFCLLSEFQPGFARHSLRITAKLALHEKM